MRKVFSSPGEREVFGNVGIGFAQVFGIQSSFITPILFLIGVVVLFASTGLRLYLRKKQGTAVLGFSWINLWGHIGLIVIILLFVSPLLSSSLNNLSVKKITGEILSDKLMLVYLVGIILAIVFHLFRDFQSSKELIESDPYYTGKGIFSFLAKKDFMKELYMNLFDPLIVLIIGYWVLNQPGGKNLGFILIFCGICFAIECVSLLAIEWHQRQMRISLEVRGEERTKFGNVGTNSADSKDGRIPRLD